jgi:hypothetical protein
MKQKINLLFLFVLLFAAAGLYAQDSTQSWDNQMYLGNKISFGEGTMKHSLELQTRFRNNLQSMDNWYIEYVTSHLISENFEIVPDLRFTVKPTKLELRPGIGVLYKYFNDRLQFVNQVKYQFDWASKGENGHAFREVVFLNKRINEKIVLTTVAGFIYRWWPSWNGFQYIRVGPGISYKLDKNIGVNFSYFVGVENRKTNWLWAGIPLIQVVINVSKTYKYTPAYYFSF